MKATNKPADQPCPRTGHSAIIHKEEKDGECLFIFGGKNDDNEKLNDLWKFQLSSGTWNQIKCDDEESLPSPRSGHSASMYEGRMLIFAGIFEITKELNDAFVFDFATQKWTCLFEEKM